MKNIFLLLFLFLFSCNTENGKKCDEFLEPNQSDNKTKVADTLNELIQNKEIVIKNDTVAIASKMQLKSFQIKEEVVDLVRMFSFPGDNNFNGKPLVEQIEISKMVLTESPDTLISMVKDMYNSFERYFPKSIADDFEHGISTEYTDYPKLIFSLEIFENSKSQKPYIIKQYVAIKKRGEQVIVE